MAKIGKESFYFNQKSTIHLQTPPIMRLFIILFLAILAFSSCQTNKSFQPITTTTQVSQNNTPPIIYNSKDSVRINLSISTRREAHLFVEYMMLKHGDTVSYPSRGRDSEMPRVRMFRSAIRLLDKDTIPSFAKLIFYSEDNKEIKSESRSSRLTLQDAELYSGCCSGTSLEFVSEAYHAKIIHYYRHNDMKDSIEVYVKF